MNSKAFHVIFWVFYIGYAILFSYLYSPGGFAFSTSIDKAVAFIYLAVVPFYAFAYFLSLVTRKKTVLLGIFFMIVFLLLHFAGEYFLHPLLQGLLYGTTEEPTIYQVFLSYIAAAINYFIFATGYYYLTRSKKTEQQLLLLQKEKLEEEEKRLTAEVAFLKAQINPHFLHNVLNYFYAQALPLSDKLAKGILSLSDIMRYALDKNTEQDGLVWVYKEIEFVKKIIAINTLRFEGNIFTNFRVTGEDISGLKIIPMILITLVENAFKHGDFHNPAHPVEIAVDYKAAEQLFCFSVFNHKSKGPKELSHGIGLDNTRNRLLIAYKNNASLTVEEDETTYKATLLLKY